MPLWACSGTEPPESSSDAVDVTVQGQMLWTVEDAREEVNFPRRFSPLASPEPLVVSARNSVCPCRGCFGHCELRVLPVCARSSSCVRASTRKPGTLKWLQKFAPSPCEHIRGVWGVCARGIAVFEAQEAGSRASPISCLCTATKCFCLSYSLLPHSHMLGRQPWDAGVAVWFFVLLGYWMYFNWIGQRKKPQNTYTYKAQGIRTRSPFPETTNG